MSTAIGDVLAGLRGRRLAFLRLVAQLRHCRNSVVTENHEAVVPVADDAGKLDLEDSAKRLDDAVSVAGTPSRAFASLFRGQRRS